jgi:hypothetical protein
VAEEKEMILDIDLTRYQMIEAISTLFIIERKHLIKFPSIEHAVIENLAWHIHRVIKPTKEEWSKTEYFKQYITTEAQEKYLRYRDD